MSRKLKKVGKYGSIETCNDEINSKECAMEIFNYLVVNHPIDGYTYKILESGVPEYLPYKRDNPKDYEVYDDMKKHKIVPDIPCIILQEDENPDNFYVILTGDDKYQETEGNAIERMGKNHRSFFEEKMCNNSDIVPYVVFCSGGAFLNEKNEFSSYFASKFRQMMPYTNTWSYNKPHSAYKRRWNLVFVQRTRFSFDEKMRILKNVALQSVNYYSELLKDI
jgi:hypothetical protein